VRRVALEARSRSTRRRRPSRRARGWVGGRAGAGRGRLCVVLHWRPGHGRRGGGGHQDERVDGRAGAEGGPGAACGMHRRTGTPGRASGGLGTSSSPHPDKGGAPHAFSSCFHPPPPTQPPSHTHTHTHYACSASTWASSARPSRPTRPGSKSLGSRRCGSRPTVRLEAAQGGKQEGGRVQGSRAVLCALGLSPHSPLLQ
jgi:hypothetical protein